MTVAVLPDFPEEQWPSMDLCGEMLLAHWPAARRECPRFVRAAGRVPVLGRKRVACNADRLLNRFAVYPRFARRLAGNYSAFHVVDHSYAHLVAALPPGRAGVYCHDLDAFRCLLEPAAEPRPAWFRRLARKTLAGLTRAAVVFVNSDQTRRQLQAHGIADDAKIVHAPLGAADEFTPEPGGEAPPWLPPAGTPYLLHVGSCIPRKRIDVLLAVFAAVRESVPGLRLVKVGGEWTPPQQELLEKSRIGPDLTHAVGVSRPDLAAAYRAAAAVLVPSESEGFGLPVVEALACGAAVVATDLPVLREVGGSAATFAPTADVPAWADAVRRVLAGGGPSRAERLSRAALFRWSRHAETIRDAYRARLGVT